jgi:alpha-L-fucosidase
MVGAYFSKPDWNTPSYWWSYFPPKDRNVNYDPKKYPQKWQSLKTLPTTKLRS